MLKEHNRSFIKKINRPIIGYGPVHLIKAAFHLGCDDFIKLPLNKTEIISRASNTRLKQVIQFSWGSIYLTPQRLYSNITDSRLNHYEYEIIAALLRFRGELVSRTALQFFLYGKEKNNSRAVDVHVSSLRKKISHHIPNNYKPNPIQCVRGKGYRLVCE